MQTTKTRQYRAETVRREKEAQNRGSGWNQLQGGGVKKNEQDAVVARNGWVETGTLKL